MFQIAAFAQLGGVSAKVLRDYDEQGLFRPAWVDRQTGYRLYSPAQLPQLRRILALRELGTGLSDIRALVVEGADLRGVLEQRRAALEDARRDLERRLSILGISLDGGQAGASPDVVVRRVGGERVATLDVDHVGGDVGRAFYELELRIRNAGVRAPGPPGALVHDSGPQAGPRPGPETEIFVPVRRPAAGLDARRLPTLRAATVLHEGPYESMAATRRDLDEWLSAAGLTGRQPVRLLYLQFGAEEDLRLPRQYLVTRAAELVTEIQLPIDG